MHVLKISKYSSLNFDKSWKRSFEQDECYIQKFGINDFIRVQYSVPEEYMIDVVMHALTEDATILIPSYHIGSYVDDAGIERTAYGFTLDEMNTGLYSIEFVAQNIVVEQAYFSVLDEACLSSTVVLRYVNRRNDYDTIFTQEEEMFFTFDFRVEGGFLPGEKTCLIENEDFRDQRHGLTQLFQLPYKKEVLTLGDSSGVPSWVAEKLNLIFSLSSILVDDLRYTRSNNSSPQITQISHLYPLYVYKIELEGDDFYNENVKLPNQDPDIEFYANKDSLSYGVSINGFDVSDTLQVTSSVKGIYRDYNLTTKPEWLTASLGETNETVNTLNLTIERNRTNDDARSGEIILTQSKTGKTIVIPIVQSGRLKEGIPTEYPYVNKEDVIDQGPSRVVQIGEQIWTMPLTTLIGHPNEVNARGCYINEWRSKYSGQWETLDSRRLQAWCDGYNGKNGVARYFKEGIIPTYEEFNTVSGRGYNVSTMALALLPGIRSFYGEALDGSNEDIHKHHIGWYDDWLELGGFLAAHNWDPEKTSSPSINNPSALTLGLKDKLDTSINGYDDVRISYPERWEWFSTFDFGANTSAVIMDSASSVFFQPFGSVVGGKTIDTILLSYDNTAGSSDRVITIYIADYDSNYSKHPTDLYVPESQSMRAKVIATYTAIKGTSGIATIGLNTVFDNGKTMLVGTDSTDPVLCISSDATGIGNTWGFDYSNGWVQRGDPMAITYGERHPVFKGIDKYAFGLNMVGTWHPYENDENVGGNIAWIFTRGNRNLIPDQADEGLAYSMRYKKSNDYGIMRTPSNELVDGYQVRALRYRELEYDIYDNGTSIIKISSESAVPDGYTKVPKGALRGAWLGNPNLTRDQLVMCETYANERLSSSNSGGIG